MCATIVYGLLGGLAAYILVTAAAFAYLPWWQAVPVSIGFFVLEVLLGRYLVKRSVRRMKGILEVALGGFDRVLQGAGVDVHSVYAPEATRPALGAARRTYTVEFTVFPPDLAASWNPTGLTFIAADSPPGEGVVAAELIDVRVIDNDSDREPAGPVTGVRRLRARFDVPAGVARLIVAYGKVEFAEIDLTKLTPTTGRDL